MALETGTTGLWYGRIIELIGTHARSSSKDEALDILEEELLYHLKWLKRHGETPPSFGNTILVIVEEVKDISRLGESGGEVALFNYDLKPVSRQMLDYCLRLMSFNRTDLLSEIKDLKNQTLTYTPPTKSRNINQILQHICNAEEFYVSRLGPEVDQIYENNLGMSVSVVDKLPVLERLSMVRQGCLETLRQVVPGKKDQVFTRPEYTNYPDEKWTAHKVMRRFLEHEREHIYNIREYLGLLPRN